MSSCRTITVGSSLSETLMQILLSKMSQELLGSVVISVLSFFPTVLAVGVLMRNSRTLTNQMHNFGVTCSYDEELRFTKSAVIIVSSSGTLQEI